MATIDEIAQLGGPEKVAARAYTENGRPRGAMDTLARPLVDLLESRERMAFLQGIHWERQRIEARLASGTQEEDHDTQEWVRGLVKP